MKVYILALFSLTLTVNSEIDNSKSNTAKNQKSVNSAFLQKFLPPKPLHHNINQRYGLHRQEFGIEALMRFLNVGLLKNEHKVNYDYNENQDEEYRRNGGILKHPLGPLYNVPNIWGYYPDKDKIGNLGSSLYYGSPNIWGYLRNNEDRLRNEEERHDEGNLRRDDNSRYLGVYDSRMKYPRSQGRRRILGHNILNNLNAYLEPDKIGYIGVVRSGKDNKDRHYFRLISRKGLDFNKRTAPATSYGLTPIKPRYTSVVHPF